MVAHQVPISRESARLIVIEVLLHATPKEPLCATAIINRNPLRYDV